MAQCNGHRVSKDRAASTVGYGRRDVEDLFELAARCNTTVEDYLKRNGYVLNRNERRHLAKLGVVISA